MSSFTDFIQPMIDAFNIAKITESLTAFLGSGYVGIAVVSILAWGAVKKLLKLVVFAVVGLVIWYICTTGAADEIINTFINAAASHL